MDAGVKLLWRAYSKSLMLLQFSGLRPYFYFRFHLYGHQHGRLCIIFARTAHQSVLDGTNGFSSSEPCAYCLIVQICQKCQSASHGHICDSTAFLFLHLLGGYVCFQACVTKYSPALVSTKICQPVTPAENLDVCAQPMGTCAVIWSS